MEPAIKEYNNIVVVPADAPKPFTYYRSRSGKRVFLIIDVNTMDYETGTVLAKEWGRERIISTPLDKFMKSVHSGDMRPFIPQAIDYIFIKKD